MLASFAFEPIVCAGFRIDGGAKAQTEMQQIDPALSPLIEEVRRLEGETVSSAPMLFKLVEVCGFGILGASALGLASGLAALAS